MLLEDKQKGKKGVSRLGEIPTTGDRQKIENKRRLNNEGLPEKLTQLRQKLNRKAAEEPAFRFYVLYDRIYRPDVLMAAYQRVRRKRGAAGVDGITFSKIEERRRRSGVISRRTA